MGLNVSYRDKNREKGRNSVWATLRLVPHGTVTIWSSVFLYLPVSPSLPLVWREEKLGVTRNRQSCR